MTLSVQLSVQRVAHLQDTAALQHCSTVCTAVLGPQSYNLQARDQEGGATNSIQHLHSSFSLFYINYFYILKIFSPARPGQPSDPVSAEGGLWLVRVHCQEPRRQQGDQTRGAQDHR